MAVIRELYETRMNGGLFGRPKRQARPPNALDKLVSRKDGAAIAAFLRTGRLYESDASQPLATAMPLTAGGVQTPVEDDADDDQDLEPQIIAIMAGEGTDQEKAAAICALFSDDETDLEESADCYGRAMAETAGARGRRIHESAGARIARYLRHRPEQQRRLAAIGCPLA